MTAHRHSWDKGARVDTCARGCGTERRETDAVTSRAGDRYEYKVANGGDHWTVVRPACVAKAAKESAK